MNQNNDNETYYPAISSNTLFHFTPKKEFLISILENDFRPRYCFETLSCVEVHSPLGLGRIHDFAIPMVCFCDIPLSLTGKHLNTYGNYGIGLTKEWGMKNGLNPVLYVHFASTLKSMVNDSIEVVNNLDFDNRKHKLSEIADVPINVDLLWETFDYLKFFTKPYQGPFKRPEKTIENVRFYDEREWRFVPRKKEGDQWKKYMYEWDFNDEIRKQEQNDLIYQDDKAALMFTPNDIKYIIVKEESEILDVANQITQIKSKYEPHERQLLTTRIISAQQIKEDF
jgi:hypothetical protein